MLCVRSFWKRKTPHNLMALYPPEACRCGSTVPACKWPRFWQLTTVQGYDPDTALAAEQVHRSCCIVTILCHYNVYARATQHICDVARTQVAAAAAAAAAPTGDDAVANDDDDVSMEQDVPDVVQQEDVIMSMT
jgi:hypothetical protein